MFCTDLYVLGSADLHRLGTIFELPVLRLTYSLQRKIWIWTYFSSATKQRISKKFLQMKSLLCLPQNKISRQENFSMPSKFMQLSKSNLQHFKAVLFNLCDGTHWCGWSHSPQATFTLGNNPNPYTCDALSITSLVARKLLGASFSLVLRQAASSRMTNTVRTIADEKTYCIVINIF